MAEQGSANDIMSRKMNIRVQSLAAAISLKQLERS